MKKMKTVHILLLAIVFACMATDSIAWACPNCGDAMASDPAQAGLVRGIFWSILFLLSMPFLIVAGLGGYFYWLVRNARRPSPGSTHATTAATEPATSPFAPNTPALDESLETVEV